MSRKPSFPKAVASVETFATKKKSTPLAIALLFIYALTGRF
jgi:hypothetical protein